MQDSGLEDFTLLVVQLLELFGRKERHIPSHNLPPLSRCNANGSVMSKTEHLAMDAKVFHRVNLD